MTPDQPIKFMAYPARVTVRNGKPICPCCNVEMVPMGNDQWQCAEGASMFRVIGLRLAEMIDKALLDSHVSPPSAGKLSTETNAPSETRNNDG